MLNVNDFKNLKSTKESRLKLLSLLNDKEKNMFKSFVKSVGV